MYVLAFRGRYFWNEAYSHIQRTKHLQKSNAVCVYTPVVLKLLAIVQMRKQQEEGNEITINLTPNLSKLIKYW